MDKRETSEEDLLKKIRKNIADLSKKSDAMNLPNAGEMRSSEEKIEYLLKNSISIEDVAAFQNAELNSLLKKSIQFLCLEEIQLLQKSDFKELPPTEKMEIQKDMIGLSKPEKDAIISKFKEIKKEL